jgi:hypothetical protein
MTDSRLHDDLIREFQEQKKSLKEQLELLDPMVSSLHKPAYKRVIHSGTSVFFEIILWLLAAGIVVFAFFYAKVTPFFVLKRLMELGYAQHTFTDFEINLVGWSVQGLLLIIALLLIIIARLMANIRQKNNVIQLSVKNMKQIGETNVRRKAAIEGIEQKYYAQLPTDDESIITGRPKDNPDIRFDEI